MTATAPIAQSPLDEAIAGQAANWLIRLEEEGCAADCAAFEAWKQSDPRHAEAAERMTSLIGRIHGLRENIGDMRPAHAALKAAGDSKKDRSRLRRTASALTLMMALAIPGWLALQAYPPSYLLADVRTAAGHPETRQLADGTTLSLRGASAVNLRLDVHQRRVELVRGEILLDVAHDAQRPFVVATKHGSIRALGTRFVVHCDGQATILTMLESRVTIKLAQTVSAQTQDEPVVSAGQRVRMDDGGLGAVEQVDVLSISDAWKFNQLVVHDAPLPDVLDELARQRSGILHYDRAALANIKVSAVLPLDDTDQALRLLATSHRLRIVMLTPWVVSVGTSVRP